MNTILFFDDWALDRRINVERKIGRPRLLKEFPLLSDAAHGEGNFVSVCGIPGQVGYRLFQTFAPSSLDEWKKTGGGIACAESDDGVEWSDAVVVAGPQMWSDTGAAPRLRDGIVFHDPDEADEARRFRMTARVSREGEMADTQARMAFSADGLRWTLHESCAWHPDNPDTANWLFRRPRAGKWALTTRPTFGDRRVAIVESDDLRTWTPPRVVLTPDAADPPVCQFYGMPAFPYEDLFVGFLWLMTVDPYELNLSKMWGRVDARLAYSHDGLAWQRMTHEPFLPCGDFAEFGGGSMYPSAAVLTSDDRILIYSRASLVEHLRSSEIPSDVQPYEMLHVHELRRDGFVCLQSAGGYGEVVTKPLQLDDPELSLNVAAPSGEVRVEITDVNGDPLEGYSLDECVPFRGDEVLWQPRWKECGELPQTSKTIRLRIKLFHAKLYAIRVRCQVCYFPGYLAEHLG